MAERGELVEDERWQRRRAARDVREHDEGHAPLLTEPEDEARVARVEDALARLWR